MKSIWIIALIVMQSLLSTSNGNERKLIFQRLNSNAGLSSDDVTDIDQDSEGFIWMTTSDGINRYDGYKVTIHTPDFTSGKSFNTSNFRCMEEDQNQNIWFGSYNFGINIYNKVSGEVSVIDNQGPPGKRLVDNHVNDILLDSKGRIWIGTTEGLNMYNPENDSIMIFDLLAERDPSTPGVYITRIYENSNGDLIVASWGQGIFIISDNMEKVSRILFKKDARIDEPMNRIWRILEDSKGTYWIGTWTAGLYHIRINADYSYEIIKTIDQLSSSIIYSLYEDPSGQIWSGTHTGLYILSEAHSSEPGIQTYFAGKDASQLSNNSIMDIIEDRSGVIWLAIQGGGVHKIDPSVNRFSTIKLPPGEEPLQSAAIRSFYSSDPSTLLVGLNGLGLGQYLLNTGAFIPYQQLPEFRNLPEITQWNGAVCLHKDHRGNFWIGTRYYGVYVVDGESYACKNYLRDGPTGGDDRRHINAITEDRFHHIWIGNEYGLFQFIPDEGGSDFKIKNHSSDMTGAVSLSGSIINAIYEDSDGYLWVGTDGNGLIRFKNDGTNSKKSFDHYSYQQDREGSLQCNFINTIYEDSKKRIWIGTQTAGLALFEKREQTFRHVRKEDGLSGNVIMDILEVGNSLFLTTSDGLTRFIWNGTNNSHFETYNYEDGLQGNVFIKGAAYKDQENNIYVGGYYGFNIFNPAELKPNMFIPPMAFTEINVAGKYYNPLSLINKANVLKFNENNIDIEFSALSFDQPNKNKYSYILEGFEEDWHKVNFDRRLARYTNLPAGHYTFKVVASNSSDIWNNDPLAFSFQIKQHPAKSWWAISSYILVVASILITIFQSQTRNVRMKQSIALERIERKREENINQFKFRFFTNISHELLTPLSVIYASVEDLLNKNKMDRGQIKILQRNTNNLMHLLSQLLDFRKVESQTMKLQVSEGDINEFLNHISENMFPLAEKKHIAVNLYGLVENLIFFDHDKVDKIVSNLLTNALRYTPENGKIFINYLLSSDDQKDWLTIDVIDSGKGIQPDMLSNVFDRFYQVESVTGRTFGSGIGLALAKNLCDIHKGWINVENDPEFGAKFTLTIPVSRNSFNTDEIYEGDLSYRSKNYIIDHAYSGQLQPEPDPCDELNEVGTNEVDKILIVEDNDDFRQMIKSHLSNYFMVLEARNGEEGFKICQEQNPSLVITDMMMPLMNGIELCKKIKNTLETSHIIVIMLTARTDEETRYESYLANADSYISKPLDIRTLQIRINSLLHQRRTLIEKYNKTGTMPEAVKGQLSTLDEVFLKKAQDFIESNTSNSELNVMILNRELGTSNSMLYRKITHLTGMSPVEFIRYIKLQYAAKMLINEDSNVSEVAFSSGFNDLSYFSKCFKKQFGISPKQYSKKVRLNS